MSNGKKKSSNIAKREKKLRKQLIKDFNQLLELSVLSGSIQQGSIRDILKQFSAMLVQVKKKKGPYKELRKPGRFLEHLNKKHGQVVKPGELTKQLHDQQTLLLIKRLKEKGIHADEIYKKLHRQGERVTEEAISRILKCC